ncbi:MAG: mandelate racemase/muconate lactonizing enzyme family protein, partial [Chloroflexi bacterium]|nr:mandelate racemase/muconate lactonizing enzyme family protein [Chloroflexota bacterium]
GIGEAGSWGHLEAAEAALTQKFAPYLVGKDPLLIEHHRQNMYRSSHFRGAAIMAALSAVDIALWDIAGKHFGVPVYQLLGGKVRDKARVYYHVFGNTRETLVKGIKDAKEQGFTAVGHLTPFLDEDRGEPYYKSHVNKMRDAIDAVRLYREAAGDDMDLCIEIHRRLTPAEAIVLANGIEEFHPYFYEDPIPPENYDAMEQVAKHISIPIATGERFQTMHEFAMLLSRGAVQYVRPDVCLAGGITHTKKIAALAEANYVGVVPHNPLGPVSTAACLQIAACIPNFALQEYPIGEHEFPKNVIVKEPIAVEEGFLIIPDAPGIGIEIAEDAQEKAPPRTYGQINVRLHKDGSVVDQ